MFFNALTFCRVPRKVFEHKADRPSAQNLPWDPASVNAMKTNMCDHYSYIVYLIPTLFALKTLLIY